MSFHYRNFYDRAVSTARIGWASSTTFATVGTAATALVVVPGLGVLFTVLLGADLSAPDPVRIGCASALASTVLAVAAGIVARVVSDRWLGVFELVGAARAMDAAYWVGVAAVPTLLSALTGATNIAVVAVLAAANGSFQGSLPLLAGAVALVPVALGAGACLGVFAAGLGLFLSDPYLGSTIMGALLPVTAGVVVPVSAYPAWLAWVCALVPGGRITAVIGGTEGAGSLAVEALVCCAWLAAGLALVRLAVVRIRCGARDNLL